ncbi:hypothetical protein ACFY1B_20370 [Streptomyces mirabilis]|uniref:hypothetical protein n=1 Tax=Streptomyces mirabilis TaxID=68239 RepID=UPI0036CAE6CB
MPTIIPPIRRRFSTSVVPALALGPAVTTHASPAAAPGTASSATCKVERDSNGKYHLWGVGFPGGAGVTFSGSSTGTVSTDHTGYPQVPDLGVSRGRGAMGDGRGP